MGKLPYAESYRELVVYQKGRELAREIFRVTANFPREEIYALTDQIRRSSRSIGAQIAEAWAKRVYEKHFLSKLTGADGEQQETQHWIEIAADCGSLTHDQAIALLQKCSEIGRYLGSMMNKSNSFCNPHPKSIRETSSEYFVD